MLTPFPYLPMVIGLRPAHGIRMLESGMLILLHCSVSCKAEEESGLLTSVVSGIILRWRMGKAK